MSSRESCRLTNRFFYRLFTRPFYYADYLHIRLSPRLFTRPFITSLFTLLSFPPQHDTFCLTRLSNLIFIMQKEKETFERLNTIAADVRNNKLTRKDLIFRKCFPDRISGQGSGYEGNVGKPLFSRVQAAVRRSVGRSVGPSVGPSVSTYFFVDFWALLPLPNRRDLCHFFTH